MSNHLIDNRKELYISDFRSYVQEKDNLSPYTTKDRWEYVPFETKETKGNLLIASYNSYPNPITISPNLNGWYKIYICLGEIGGLNHIDIKLNDDEFPTTISSCRMAPYTMWITSENVEESFWKCADMTQKYIEISKPITGIKYSSNLFWFHFIPMSDNEIEKYKKETPKRHMIAHMDGDFHANDVKNTPFDYCKPIFAMKDSDVSIICQEVTNDICDYKHACDDYIYRDDFGNIREKYYKELTTNRDTIYKEQIKYAHKHGIEMFASQRMQLSNFAFPLEQPLFHNEFVDKNKDKRCINRDGTFIDFLSYGYGEVQDYIIDNLLESAKHGFDGVLNIWTRGIHLMFEKPVEDHFKEKYGNDIDMHLLPEDDIRIIETKSDIFVDFYKKVKKALSKYSKDNNTKMMKIFITGCYDIQSNLKLGIDIERLAKEGLIDGVIQTKMKQYEEIEDVLNESGLIDIEKYKEKAKKEIIYSRISGSLIDLLVDGTKEYRRIVDKYGLDYYTEIQWETYKKPEEYVDGAKKIFSSFGKGISLWDCYPNRVNILSEWNAVSRLGNKEEVLNMSENPNSYHRIIKVLSYNNQDVRYVNPSWRG